MPKSQPIPDEVMVGFRCPRETILRFDEAAKRNERTRSGHLRWLVEQEAAGALAPNRVDPATWTRAATEGAKVR